MYARTATVSLAAVALLGAGALLLIPHSQATDSGTETGASARTDTRAGSVLRTAVSRRAVQPPDAPAVFAHRGASAYAPENTLPAVDRAGRLGFAWVENDVQRTRDGVLVVIHDTDLKRTTDVEKVFPKRAPWAVKDFTAAEIARLDAGSWFGTRYTGTRVPTLKQYLDRIEHNHQNLLLEIKSPEMYPGIERETLRVLSRKGWLDADHARNRLVIQSFGAGSVRKVHQQRPDVTTGFLGTPKVADLKAYAAFTDQINPSYASIGARYVAAVHALKGPHGRKLRVNTWTVDDAATAVKVNRFHVDGIITNAPDVVRGATG
ncbi:glycerophosphodiester phosphodiesterase [Streptomyces sp. JH14]|uniref:glycerophosphodiester phosphodiesterase n=1 Tax=Streptomyces sp. JH14 TaxID=2793630 RepID=UPI0023F86E97|nr:glycerophosphodiester phosphodiesterase family protein [Streptomyces sp. JH14]MDF6041795.1 glycerophosphodiester phosphodiesterase [Streptomyces sp. JH14]